MSLTEVEAYKAIQHARADEVRANDLAAKLAGENQEEEQDYYDPLTRGRNVPMYAPAKPKEASYTHFSDFNELARQQAVSGNIINPSRYTFKDTDWESKVQHQKRLLNIGGKKSKQSKQSKKSKKSKKSRRKSHRRSCRR
jgi:hypothetical protein